MKLFKCNNCDYSIDAVGYIDAFSGKVGVSLEIMREGSTEVICIDLTIDQAKEFLQELRTAISDAEYMDSDKERKEAFVRDACMAYEKFHREKGLDKGS